MNGNPTENIRALSEFAALDLNVLLTLAAVFLGLSVAVEVIQELYKFITTSKANAYRRALIDFIGEDIEKSRKDRTLGGMLLRGPFQWLSRQSPVHLLPATEQQLVRALERTTHLEVQRALESVRAEAARQGGVPRSPSPPLQHWFRELRKTLKGSPCAEEIVTYLEELGVAVKPSAGDPEGQPGGLSENSFDAAAVLDSLYQRFLPKAKIVAREFEQFATNFDHSYRRRNLRQTLVIAFLLAVSLNLPLGALYRQARSLSPAQVTQLAEAALKLEQSIAGRGGTSATRRESEQPGAAKAAKGNPGAATDNAPIAGGGTPANTKTPAADTAGETQSGASGSTVNSADDKIQRQVAALLTDLDAAVKLTLNLGTKTPVFRPIWQVGKDGVGEHLRATVEIENLLQCLATAVLIVFGAPFWHRVSKALLGARRPAAVVTAEPAQPTRGES